MEFDLNERAFFIQGDFLILPADADDSLILSGVPLELAEDFETSDNFEIPALNPLQIDINVVSVPPNDKCENAKKVPIRQVLAMFETGKIKGNHEDISAILRACHIAQWRQTSRFCGTCGTENCDAALEEEPVQLAATPFPLPPPPILRASPLPSPHRVCPNCGREEFPRICPAVIVLITDDAADGRNRILLAHNKKFRHGLYSLISGFCEAGESLEETLKREVYEEANILIKDIEYVKSQPWPFPNSLMIGFRARYALGTLKPDGEEIEDAQWFTKESLPEIPAEGSLSRWLINEWLTGDRQS